MDYQPSNKIQYTIFIYFPIKTQDNRGHVWRPRFLLVSSSVPPLCRWSFTHVHPVKPPSQHSNRSTTRSAGRLPWGTGPDRPRPAHWSVEVDRFGGPKAPNHVARAATVAVAGGPKICPSEVEVQAHLQRSLAWPGLGLVLLSLSRWESKTGPNRSKFRPILSDPARLRHLLRV